MALADDESKVWLIAERAIDDVAIRAFDMISGSQLLAIPLRTAFRSPLRPRGLLIDEVGQRVAISYVVRPPPRFTLVDIVIFDAQTGADVERTAVGSHSSLHFDRGTRTILTLSQSIELFYCDPPVLRALFPEPGRPPAITRFDPAGWRFDSADCAINVAFASPPVAPLFNAPVVSSDRSVSLSWSGPPELTTGFVVEAGSAPGLADLASFSVDGATTLTVPNVPSGSYFVRVRARNYIGVSVASNEARVDVP